MTDVEHPWSAALDALRRGATARLDARDAAAVVTRAEHVVADLWAGLHELFGTRTDTAELLGSLLDQALAAAAERSEELRTLDHQREIVPGWFQSPDMLGYVCYVDRFDRTLRRVGTHLDHLSELGVRYLHLMPVLQARPGENDGGYAVMDHRCIEPALGTMDDLEELTGRLRRHGISLCLDVVVNHVAREHDWARRARAGDPAYRDYFLVFDDRTLPDQYESTLREVFPDFAPGSFTWDDDLAGWVWTTFHDYQWDLNHANPAVFAEMLGVMLFLANRGVEVLRIDAAPFTWKRLGTDCENLREAHLLLRAWRALVSIAAPAVVFKAEAIVPLDQLVPYLGAAHRGADAPVWRECDLAYNNQLMVQIWNMLATREARLATLALGRLGSIPDTTSWCTYVRCHDDIGWAIDDEDAGRLGWGGASHRRFLADFYAGRFPGSFARGLDFQLNPDTGDVRTSGTAASLCGIEAALESADAHALELGVRRLVLAHSIAYSFGGIPLLYMGDELALRNDHSFLDDPDRRADNRWVHRPAMDWEAATRCHDPTTLEGQVFEWLVRLGRARASIAALHGSISAEVCDSGNEHVLVYRRGQPRRGTFLAAVNVGERAEYLTLDSLHGWGVSPQALVLASSEMQVIDRVVELPPLSFAWFAVGPVL